MRHGIAFAAFAFFHQLIHLVFYQLFISTWSVLPSINSLSLRVSLSPSLVILEAGANECGLSAWQPLACGNTLSEHHAPVLFHSLSCAYSLSLVYNSVHLPRCTDYALAPRDTFHTHTRITMIRVCQYTLAYLEQPTPGLDEVEGAVALAPSRSGSDGSCR